MIKAFMAPVEKAVGARQAVALVAAGGDPGRFGRHSIVVPRRLPGSTR